MSDEARRQLERDAAGGDLQAIFRLAHERCRAGECCAHSQSPTLRPPPPEALTALVQFESFNLDSVAFTADVSFRVMGADFASVTAVVEWLRETFPNVPYATPDGYVTDGPPTLGDLYGLEPCSPPPVD